MSNVFYLLTVAERSRLPDFMQIFRETGVEVCFVTLGHGTMDTASLRYPPLSSAEKAVCMSICDQGYGETVMDAARSAGAGGGTIIHAKGTGMESAEKFFGVTLASDKTLVLIATKTSNKDGIMQAIMKMAGPDTPAHAISFSLPVTQTAGLRLTDGLAPEDEPSAEG